MELEEKKIQPDGAAIIAASGLILLLSTASKLFKLIYTGVKQVYEKLAPEAVSTEDIINSQVPETTQEEIPAIAFKNQTDQEDPQGDYFKEAQSDMKLTMNLYRGYNTNNVYGHLMAKQLARSR